MCYCGKKVYGLNRKRRNELSEYVVCGGKIMSEVVRIDRRSI